MVVETLESQIVGLFGYRLQLGCVVVKCGVVTNVEPPLHAFSGGGRGAGEQSGIGEKTVGYHYSCDKTINQQLQFPVISPLQFVDFCKSKHSCNVFTPPFATIGTVVPSTMVLSASTFTSPVSWSGVRPWTVKKLTPLFSNWVQTSMLFLQVYRESGVNRRNVFTSSLFVTSFSRWPWTVSGLNSDTAWPNRGSIRVAPTRCTPNLAVWPTVADIRSSNRRRRKIWKLASAHNLKLKFIVLTAIPCVPRRRNRGRCWPRIARSVEHRLQHCLVKI